MNFKKKDMRLTKAIPKHSISTKAIRDPEKQLWNFIDEKNFTKIFEEMEEEIISPLLSRIFMKLFPYIYIFNSTILLIIFAFMSNV